MKGGEDKMVLGVFSKRTFAEQAIMDLEASGFNPKDVSIVMRDQSHAEEIAHSTGASVTEGAVSGATTGGVVGGLAGLLIGIGAIAVPGLGGLLIGGPLAAALGLSGAAATTISGAVTGAVAGGLIGALMGLGVSEDDAKFYEDRVRDGAILLAIPDGGRQELAIDILEDNQAENIRVISDFSSSHRVEDIPRDNKTSASRYEDPYYARDMGYVGAKGGELDADSPRRDRGVIESLKDMVRGTKRR